MPTAPPPLPERVTYAKLDATLDSVPTEALVVHPKCHPASPVRVYYHGDRTFVLVCAACDIPVYYLDLATHHDAS